MEEILDSCGPAEMFPEDKRKEGQNMEWKTIGERMEEILDSCGPAEMFPDLDSGESKTPGKRNLLRPLAREIATMENDLSQCKRRDARYFALLKAYEAALTTLKKL
ncbi:MAG: hypothetical protein PUE38_07510 [Olsenella sp.]|nr:hypothetical protein [Olsenella sp.]